MTEGGTGLGLLPGTSYARRFGLGTAAVSGDAPYGRDLLWLPGASPYTARGSKPKAAASASPPRSREETKDPGHRKASPDMAAVPIPKRRAYEAPRKSPKFVRRSPVYL